MTVTISYGQWWRTIASVTKKLNVTKGGVAKSMCCGDIQGPSRILIIMTDSDRHHFIWTAMIFCDGPFMAITIGAYIWRCSLTVTINSLVTSRFVMNINYNDKQWPSPFHINNNDLWWQSFNCRHYWCVYMVAFVDCHHFIFCWGSKKCHHKLIGDGQKSIHHQKLIFVIPYIWISEHDGIEPPTSYL